MKRFFTLITAFVLCFNLYGQKDTAYIHTFGGIQNDGCKQVQPTPDGGYIMIGTTSSFGAGNTDFYAIKTDSLCNFKWSKCYGGPLNEEGFSVTTTLDKGYAFVGFTNSYGAGGYDVFLVKTDSMGNQKWQKTYGGSNWDFGYSIQQLKDSGYVICGLTYSYGSVNGSMYIIRTDKMGDTLWTRTVGDSDYTIGNALTVFEDSLFIIAGASTSYHIGDTNAVLVEINDKGTIKWTKKFGGDSNDFRFNSIHITPDKGLLMYGTTDSISGNLSRNTFENEYFLKTDSLGKPIEGHDMDSPKYGFGADARELPNGSFITLGSNASFGAGGLDFRTFDLDPSSYYISGPTFGGGIDEIAGSIAFGKNGDVILAGSSDSYPLYSCGLFDVFIVRLTFKNDTLPNTYDTVVHRFIDNTEWPASVSPLQQDNVGVNIFPNPISTSATILVQGKDFIKYTFNLFNITGQAIMSNYPLKNIGNGQAVTSLQKGSLCAGDYMYEILSNGETKVASGKLIIE